MRVKEEIQSIANSLSKTWFEDKFKAFKKENGYNLDSNRIVIEVEDFSKEYDEYGNVVGHVDCSFKREISFREYCQLYLPINELTNWGMYPHTFEKPKIPNNLLEISSEITLIASASLPLNASSKEKFDFYFKFKSMVKDAFDESEDLENKEWNEIKTDLAILTSLRIDKDFELQTEFYGILDQDTDTLDFNLKGSELVALIFLLQRAGFLNYTDNSYLDFCFRHFRFKNQKDKSLSRLTRFSSPKKIQNDYSEMAGKQRVQKINTATDSAMRHIVGQLKKIT